MNVVNGPPAEAALPDGAVALRISDSRYPPLLRAIPDPPATLYVLGDPAVLHRPHFAIVGSRKASPAGLRAARSLSMQLSGAGLSICSGLALGIDGAAHRGALDASGKSVAVMATGIDNVYPARHRGLATDLCQSGCLVSEFAPGTPPRRGNFPRRNRIISGMSLGVMVIEAALPSGSLITAGTALDQGREVFTLPWSVFHRGGAGCLRLLRDGAKMVQSAEDVLEELSALYQLHAGLASQMNSKSTAAAPGGEYRRQQVLELVGYETITVDELASCSALPIEQLLSELSALELDGLVERHAGGYIRC